MRQFYPLITFTFTTLFCCISAQADSRYYLLQTDYQWQIFATQDDVAMRDTIDQPQAENPVPAKVYDPLEMTLLIRVDDANTPGRKAKVTFWFKKIIFTDDLRSWSITDFGDAALLRDQAQEFLTQPRALADVPVVLAYEEEAVGVLMSLAHGQSLMIDFDVPPDMPDPLIFQADALIASILSDASSDPMEMKNGLMWPESDAKVRELESRVLSSDVQRVERVRQLLWHHLKTLAFFAENHQYDYFNPRALESDAPRTFTLLSDDRTPIPLQADLSSTTPAFSFPALYRWASMTDEDFAKAVGESEWEQQNVDNAAAAIALTPTDAKTRGYAKRLQLTRESLAKHNDWRTISNRDRFVSTLQYRYKLGKRYIDTLISLHRHFKRTGSRAVAVNPDPNQVWAARFPIEQATIIVDSEGRELRTEGGARYGLWFAALDDVRFKVNDRIKPADRFRIAQRKLSVLSSGDDIPLYVPGLISDHSSARLAVVSFKSETNLEGRLISKKRAMELLAEWTQADVEKGF